jgi:hypothetical protein
MAWSESQLHATKDPIKIPPAKKRFHASFFQLYLKKEMLAGKQAAQIWRRLDDMPNALFPRIRRRGTISPINGPEIHQGQCCFIISTIQF